MKFTTSTCEYGISDAMKFFSPSYSILNPTCHFQQRVLQCQQPEGPLNGRFREGDEAGVPASATSEAGHERELAVLLRGAEEEGQAGGAVHAGVHTHEGLDGACNSEAHVYLHTRG